MVKQWRNSRISHKPYCRYNPSLRQKIPSAYRRWFLVIAVLAFIIGILIIACAIVLNNYDNDLKGEYFHLWVGIPLLVLGVVSFICFLSRKKGLAIAFIVLSFIMFCVSIAGAFGTGVYYWKDNWRMARYSLEGDRCSVSNNVCVCVDIPSENMPTKIDSCDDMETMVKLIIVEIFFSTVAFIISTMALFLSFMSICCAPWMYAEWYDPGHDPDFPNVQPHEEEPVKQVGTTNYAYGETKESNYYN